MAASENDTEMRRASDAWGAAIEAISDHVRDCVRCQGGVFCFAIVDVRDAEQAAYQQYHDVRMAYMIGGRP